MFKIYSKSCQYALRILARIPPDKAGGKFLAVDLCREAGVPLASSRKVLQLLVEHRYLQAIPGPGGGYRLLKNPKKISLMALIKTIDGPDVFDKCIMGLPHCSLKNPCPTHDLWQIIKKDMIAEMSKKSLSDLMNSSKRRAK